MSDNMTGHVEQAGHAKRLNEMDNLRDMGRFPTEVYVGATGNILQTLVVTYLIHGRSPRLRTLLQWTPAIVAANVLPVVYLRTKLDERTEYAVIEEMDFFTDQQKFAPWVYGVASANMAFWVVLAWVAFTRRRGGGTLAAVLAVAFVCTFFPAWRRLFVPESPHGHRDRGGDGTG